MKAIYAILIVMFTTTTRAQTEISSIPKEGEAENTINYHLPNDNSLV